MRIWCNRGTLPKKGEVQVQILLSVRNVSVLLNLKKLWLDVAKIALVLLETDFKNPIPCRVIALVKIMRIIEEKGYLSPANDRYICARVAQLVEQ